VADASRRPTLVIDIRRAEHADALCLHALATQVFLDTYARSGIRPIIAREVKAELSENTFERLLADPRHCVLLAEHERHLVGFVDLGFRRTHERVAEKNSAELCRIYVQAPFIGRSIGTTLVEAAEAEARRNGASAIWLTAWASNERALRFYARRGYRELGAVPFVFEDETHENRLFAKTL
jgi:ribosomal protein S18 acetylase RimI-like enzyme